MLYPCYPCRTLSQVRGLCLVCTGTSERDRIAVQSSIWSSNLHAYTLVMNVYELCPPHDFVRVFDLRYVILEPFQYTLAA